MNDSLNPSSDKRYTCVHPSCLIAGSSAPTYYSTWTSLQHHIRTAHPPMCPHSLCNGRTFASHHSLRAHLKLHEEKEVEGGLYEDNGEEEDDVERTPKRRRRGGEFGRDWKCEIEGCGKDFKSVSVFDIDICCFTFCSPCLYTIEKGFDDSPQHHASRASGPHLSARELQQRLRIQTSLATTPYQDPLHPHRRVRFRRTF